MKLMRTLLAGEAEGISTGVGEDVIDSSGESRGEGDSDVTEEIGLGDSCAAATEANMASRNAKVIVLVPSTEVETSPVFRKSAEEYPGISRPIRLRSGQDFRSE